MTDLMNKQLPPITPEFFNRLEEAFPMKRITPNSSMEEIQYNAGQRDVLEWCRRAVVGPTKIYGEPKSFIQKLIHKYKV